jgi:hypothetical protein
MIWERMVRIVVVGVGVDMRWRMITIIVPIILFHSRLSLGQRLERTVAAVTVTLGLG